jgi:DNA-binding NtrC family response regulator
MTAEKVSVLVVDDEESIRNLLQRILEGAGYRVTAVASGKEALFKVSMGEVEVVLLDIKMPEMSGIEVLSRLTAESPDVCVIMVTSVVDMNTAVEAMKLGAYEYITKPFERDEVLQKVLVAIERWRQQSVEKHRYLELQKSIAEKTQLMQEQFMELISSLSREHKLLHKLAGENSNGKATLSKLPVELQKPLSSVEEFTDALLRILKRTGPGGKA